MLYSLRYEKGIFEIATFGKAEVNGFLDFIEDIVYHEKWKPGGLILIDHTDLNAAPLKMNELKIIADCCKSLREEIGKSRCAIVADSDLEYGIGRMWQVLVEVDIWDATQALFKSREEAIDWLRE